MLLLRPGHARRLSGLKLGFTLIELLVVVAIIALLVSILLPSLNKARKAARSTVCMAHLSGAGKAVNIYATEFRGFLPGPNTSGKAIVSGVQPSAIWKNDSAFEPIQNVDWISPSMGSDLRLPKEVGARLVQIFNNDFKCPEVNFTYNDRFAATSGPVIPLPAGTDFKNLIVSSYASPLAFHLAATGGNSNIGSSTFLNGTIRLPRSYKFKIDNVGPPSNKLHAVDGARYLDTSNSQYTFNDIGWQPQGGNFMVAGAPFAGRTNAPKDGAPRAQGEPHVVNATRSGSVFTAQIHSLSERYTYRHGDRDSINAVFFDAHVDTLDAQESIKTSLWAPRGTEIVAANNTVDWTDVNGQKLD